MTVQAPDQNNHNGQLSEWVGFLKQNKPNVVVLAFFCAVIAVLGVAYVVALKTMCATADPLDPAGTWPCKEYTNGRGLSEIFPVFWLAYFGIALSLTSLFRAWWMRNGQDGRLYLWRTIVLNAAIFYIIWPFSWGFLDWHGETQGWSILGGALVALPASLFAIVLLYGIPQPTYPYYYGHEMFGWANIYVSFIHLLIVLTGYCQYYLIPGLVRRRRKTNSAEKPAQPTE